VDEIRTPPSSLRTMYILLKTRRRKHLDFTTGSFDGLLDYQENGGFLASWALRISIYVSKLCTWITILSACQAAIGACGMTHLNDGRDLMRVRFG
jgi:hypothetical protein